MIAWEMRPRSLTGLPWALAQARMSALRSRADPVRPAVGPRRVAALRATVTKAGERLAEPGGVGVAEVDLVGETVETERDGLSGLTSVNVVNEKHPGLSRHGGSPFIWRSDVAIAANLSEPFFSRGAISGSPPCSASLCLSSR
ncbi:hypothetical protein ABH917_001687 [Thermobifida halotolerans]